MTELPKKALFSDFYKIADENPKALKLLVFIIDNIDKNDAMICSYKVFEEALEMSSRTVSRAIEYLRKKGFLSIYKSGSSNIFVVNEDKLHWKKAGNNFGYCKITANVILSKNEQTQ